VRRTRTTAPFSIGRYLAIVFGLSWPFQFVFLIVGDTARPVLLVAMLMAGVGAFVAGRYVFRDGFDSAGWIIGNGWYYALALALSVFLWGVPTFLEWVFGAGDGRASVSWRSIVVDFGTAFVITLGPAFGEEFSWRGYLLPRLLMRYPERRALLLQGLITWLWHVPFVAAVAPQLGLHPALGIPVLLAVSLLPTVMHAVVFAHLWSRSGSLLVTTVYHAAFDEVRDTLQAAIGFGVLAENWQAVALTVMGGVLLWKVRLRPARATVRGSKD